MDNSRAGLQCQNKTQTKSSSWFGTPIHDPVHVMPFYVNNWSSYVGSTFVFLSNMKFVSDMRFEFFQHIHVQQSCAVGIVYDFLQGK